MSRRAPTLPALDRRNLTPWILAGIAACAGATLRAQDKPAAPAVTVPAGLKGSLLSALPSDTALVIRVPNVKALVDKVKASPLGQLQDQVDVKKALEAIQSKLGPELARAEKELGFHPLDTLLGIDGEWVLAVGGLGPLATALSESLQMGQVPDNLNPESIPILLAADAGSSAPKVHDAIEKLVGVAQKDGAKVERFDYKGGKIIRLSEADPPANAEPKDQDGDDAGKKDGGGDGKKDGIAPPQDAENDDSDPKDEAKEAEGDDDEDELKKPSLQVFVGELGGRFYVSLSRATLEACMLPRDADRADGLASQATFQETSQALGGGDFLAFVNIKQVIGSIDNALSTTFFAFFWQKLQTLLFGPSLNNLGVSGSIDAGGLTETIFVHNAGAAEGLLGVIKGEAFAPGAPAPVPPDAKTFSSSAFNPAQLAKIIRETVQLAMSLQGQQGDLDQLLESQIGIKFTDLMGGLGKRMHSFSGMPKLENPFAGLNYVLELKEDGGINKVLKKVSEMSNGQFDAEKFKEWSIYSADTGTFGINAVAADKLLVLSTSRSDVEKVLTRSPDATPGGEWFKKATAAMPAQVTMVGYNSPDYMKAMIRGLVDSAGANAPEDAEPFLKALGAAADVFGPGWSYGAWRDKGLFITGRIELVGKK